MIVFLYNLFQILSWSALLTLTIQLGVSLPADQFLTIYHDNAQYRLVLEIAQGSAFLDMVFSVLGLTRNSPSKVIPQIVSRLYILWLILPYAPRPDKETDYWTNYYTIQIMLVAWAQSEIVRFTYYSFPSL